VTDQACTAGCILSCEADTASIQLSKTG